MDRRISVILLGIVLLCSSACANIQKPIRIRTSSDAQLNLADNEESLPVLLKIYQLSDETEFQQASFDDLWKRDQKALCSSFQGQQTYTLYPNKVQRFSFNKKGEARYIGFFATFRKPSREHWKKIIKVPPGARPRTIDICLKNNELK
jgi:type VI secretion system protein VasD